MKVDWYAMTPEEQSDAVNAAPPVAGPWIHDTWPASDGFAAVDQWARDNCGNGGYAAWIRRSGEQWELQHGHCGLPRLFGSAEAAKSAADDALTSSGWRLCT